MALPTFHNELKDTLRRLNAKEYSSTEERDGMLERLKGFEGVKPKDMIWMVFRPDRALREAGVEILKKIRTPEIVDLFVSESQGKPDAAFRAATTILFSLGVPDTEARLVQLVASDNRATAEAARRMVLESEVTPNLEPLLWQLALSDRPEHRLPALRRLATLPPDDKRVPRWQKLAREGDRQIADKAIEYLAAKAPGSSVDLLVERLPLANYSTQQLLVQALTNASKGKGPEFADQILPLMASGEAATRSVVLKILLGMENRRELVKRYIAFSKSLAGWARDRALDSMKQFGADLLEPTIELLSDPDEEIRAAAMIVAASFDDPRIIPPTIELLGDPDWWIRINAIETLGRFRDPRAVEPIVKALDDPDVRWSAVEALGRIADNRALPALGKLLADPNTEVRIEVLQSLRHFRHPQVLEVLQKVATTDPSRPVRARALDIATEISTRDNSTITDSELRTKALAARAGQGEPRLHALLVATRNQNASDFHLSVGQPPTVRIAAELLRAQGEPFSAADTEGMMREILTDAQREQLESRKQLDFCYFIPQAGRYRVNAFYDQKGCNAVFRVIPETPPTIAEIGLPARLAEIADFHQGLVLICGPTGSGKSTTLAALVNLFNETRHDHVLTLEDPVEFVHPFKNCLINQREVGTHTESFARALRAALREDPDVIVIGEMRDNDTISLALTAAETGHIVLGTINSTSAPKAIDRMISSFPIDEQAQVRTSMSESLKYVVAQRLLPARQGRRRVACYEILRSTGSIANMIRDEKTFQIYSQMQIGKSQGMQTFDEGLKDLLRRNEITPETAYLAAERKDDFEPLVSAEFLSSQSLV